MGLHLHNILRVQQGHTYNFYYPNLRNIFGAELNVISCQGLGRGETGGCRDLDWQLLCNTHDFRIRICMLCLDWVASRLPRPRGSSRVGSGLEWGGVGDAGNCRIQI